MFSLCFICEIYYFLNLQIFKIKALKIMQNDFIFSEMFYLNVIIIHNIIYIYLNVLLIH